MDWCNNTLQCNGQNYCCNRKDLKLTPKQIIPLPANDFLSEPTFDVTTNDTQKTDSSNFSPDNATVVSGTPLKVSPWGHIIKAPKQLFENIDI